VEALQAYYRDLGVATARFRRYPTEGVDAGLAGRTIFRLDVASGGGPRALRLLSSSGHEALDRAALDMLRLAASHTAVPEALQGDDFIIDLAVDFAPPVSAP
jgi:TonB family protein